MPWFDSLKWIFDGLNIHIIKRFVVYACAFFPCRFFLKTELKLTQRKSTSQLLHYKYIVRIRSGHSKVSLSYIPPIVILQFKGLIFYSQLTYFTNMYHEYLINVREAHIEKFNVKLMFYDMKYFIDLQIE